MVLRPVDKVLDDEEIIGETHPGDGLEFEIKPFGSFFVKVSVSFPCSLVGEVAEIGD